MHGLWQAIDFDSLFSRYVQDVHFIGRYWKPGLGLLRPEGIEEAMEVKLFVGKGWRKKAFRTQ